MANFAPKGMASVFRFAPTAAYVVAMKCRRSVPDRPTERTDGGATSGDKAILDTSLPEVVGSEDGFEHIDLDLALSVWVG
jgi:hypothetical protein